MAKGLRASTRKKNNAALRDRLFGPAIDARTERLSAKLQELAAKPRPDQERVMEVDSQTTNAESSADTKDDGQCMNVKCRQQSDTNLLRRNGC